MNGGKEVTISAGRYIYVGSAMGKNEGLFLPKRLLRHATRSNGLPQHVCRQALLSHFVAMGLPEERLVQQSSKRLFWNIDYLLNRSEAELQDILYIRSDNRLEFAVAQALESRDDIQAPVPGLGANDHRGHSHFLELAAESESWQHCVAIVMDCISEIP
jgi:Uri superfamily endonuclease